MPYYRRLSIGIYPLSKTYFLYLKADNYDMYIRFLGALSNSGRTLANYSGIYRGFQATGATISWALDADQVPFMTEFALNLGGLVWFTTLDFACYFP